MMSVSNISIAEKRADREPLFPLPLVILPNGRQLIRVIEPKYIDLITHALKRNSCFVIAFDVGGMNTPYQWGVYARVVNFDLTEQKFLVLSVEAVKLIALEDCEKKNDGVWTAVPRPVFHWTMLNRKEDTGKFSVVLRKLFSSYPQLSELYSDTRFEQMEWVCARLLELLPIPNEAKSKVLNNDNFQSVVEFLDTIIDDSKY